MSWVPTPSASLSGQTAEEVKALSAGLAEAALAARRKSLWPHSPSG